MFLSHYTGSGLSEILDLTTDEYFKYLDSALELYEIEIKNPRRVILSGIEKR